MWVQPEAGEVVAEKDFWVAKILDVRATDAAHVYAKVPIVISIVATSLLRS